MSDIIADGICRGPNGCFYFSVPRLREAMEKAGGHVNVAERLLVDAAISADKPESVSAREILADARDDEPRPGLIRRALGLA